MSGVERQAEPHNGVTEQRERVESGVQPVARAIVRAANDQHHHEAPPELSDVECEGAAQEVLSRVGAEQHPTPLAPHLLARALGLRLSPRAPSGCRGAVDLAAWSIRWDGRGDPEIVTQRCAHELGHVAAAIVGVPSPHAERSIDRIAAALVLPRSAVRAAIRATGFDPVLLVAALAGAPPAWALLRAAWVAERPVIVHVGGARWTWAPEGHELPPCGSWERGMLEQVRATGRRYVDLLGSAAWPIGFREKPGVVILPV